MPTYPRAGLEDRHLVGGIDLRRSPVSPAMPPPTIAILTGTSWCGGAKGCADANGVYPAPIATMDVVPANSGSDCRQGCRLAAPQSIRRVGTDEPDNLD